jgi:hypothetical protein
MVIKDAIQKGARLSRAYLKWNAAAKERTKWEGQPGITFDESGRPIRTPEEIERLFAVCSSNRCGKYITRKAGHGACRLCGCRLNLMGKVNKLYMATEVCPQDPNNWKHPEQEVPKVAEVKLSRQERIRQRKEAREKRVADRAERAAARAERIRKRQEHEATLPPLHPVRENEDPLVIYGRDCQPMGHALRNLWCDRSAFLVCGGPSTNALDMSVLKERGIVSLGINNVCGLHPVRAFVCGDQPEKFHHGIFFDPAIMKFVPKTRMNNRIRVKQEDGTFADSAFTAKSCPSLFGYRRDSTWEPEKFLSSEAATWGLGKKQHEETKAPKILFTFFTGLRLLHYLGARRVFLLGADFGMSADRGYSFNQARWAGAIRGNNNHYRIAEPMCHELVPVFKAADYEVYNCNPHSHLRAFSYIPFDEAVEDCRGLVPKEPFDLSGWYEKGEENERETD